MARIILLRHGETEWNQKRLIQGQLDSPLTQEGKSQAIRMGKFLKQLENVDQIITSDLGRAVSTANFLNHALNKKVLQDERLREVCMGEAEGLPLEKLSGGIAHRRDRVFGGEPGARMNDGESFAEVAVRVHELLDELLAYPDKTFVLISHGLTISIVVKSILGLSPEAPRKFRIPNTTACILTWNEHWQLEGLGIKATEHALDEIM